MNEYIKHKILIVDDQHKNIQVLGSLLREKNYIIGVAMNGKQAIERLVASDDYDLILLDVNMPVMDGYEACKAIRKHKKLKEIPIIFLTALVEPENIVMGLEAGGQDYITKPFNSKELLARVNTHLELKKSKDQLKQVNEWLDKKVKERTEELQIANNKLLELDRAKTEFLNIISHEIRTPLNGIIGALSIITHFELPLELKEMLEVLQTSTNRLEEFSQKALDVSLFNTKGEKSLNLSFADLNEIINHLVIKFQESAQLKGISIVYLNEASNSIVKIDERFIAKSFSYIIDNAIKFGDRESQITIKTTATPESFIIVFEDEGALLPEWYNISFIQPFNTKSHIDENSALSLFLSKQIIEAHKGKIEMINRANGVTVTVVIPREN
ncbi:MAG: hybrid sensor histidine kinase/response regulator [Bacteroidales bacterium]|nr:hybrid sensor histidine kinase/response regulator [Bacteroidales bacterium]MDD4657072.1 hybrid sensor histidine kinase/response regulator [Bacteroidales bacterium]